MFHFPTFPPTHYEFTRRRPDTTLARFPHSDILGSTLACQLPEAYRRLQRPSSALHTKASTERPKTPTKQKNDTPTQHMQACQDARVHYTIPKHHTNTPTNRQQTPSTHQERHGHNTQEPNSMPSIPITVPHPTTTPPNTGKELHGTGLLPRKEVIQPHLPVRLPCYDFVPITNPTFEHSPQNKPVGPCASGVADFRDVTGGVYKARERIHRSVADLRLLATPTSWGRVADPNPN